MNRLDVTEKIISTKVSKGIKWSDVADKVGLSKEWVTAACLGQMTLDAKQAKIIGKIFGLTAEEQKWLQVVPYKGSLPTPVPTDPLIYRAKPRNQQCDFGVRNSQVSDAVVHGFGLEAMGFAPPLKVHLAHNGH